MEAPILMPVCESNLVELSVKEEQKKSSDRTSLILPPLEARGPLLRRKSSSPSSVIFRIPAMMMDAYWEWTS
jgi:hypothetical protein